LDTDYIKTKTPPREKIFVWGRAPEIYYFSETLPASRFIACNFIVGMTTYNYKNLDVDINKDINEQAWGWFMDDLQKNKPYIIIDTAVSNFRQYGKYKISYYSQLKNFIQINYNLDKTIEQWDIYSRKFSY